MLSEPMQMDPNVWGPPLWDLLFTLAFRSADVKNIAELFRLLEKVIPCQHCRRSYAVMMNQHKLTLITDAQDSAAVWLWTVHDMVNQKLGKVAINFEVLKKKHKSFLALTSDLLVVDLLGMMTFVAKDEYVSVFAAKLIDLLRTLPGFRLPAVWKASDAPMLHRLHAAHATIAPQTCLNADTFDAFRERLSMAYA